MPGTGNTKFLKLYLLRFILMHTLHNTKQQQNLLTKEKISDLSRQTLFSAACFPRK